MSFYDSIIRPILFKMPTETAHELGLNALKLGLSAKFLQRRFREKFACDEFGELSRFGLKFKNPFGVAAGFDKNAVVANQLGALGFGFVEVGTLTFQPQRGNPKPRLFRLPADKALINRAGFNNDGTPAVVERLKKQRPASVLGVNIGKNKDVANEAATENYLASFDLAHEVADYIAVNVSSPNTPNLRELQKADSLETLLTALQARNDELNLINKKNLPLLLKIAPDLSDAEIEAITDVCLRLKLAGIIATNTTVSRNNLHASGAEIERIGSGGLSGKPLGARSTEVVSKIYRYSKAKLPVIGVGGIFTARDAFDKIAAGACLVQAYTGFVYQGLTFARDVNFGLAKILREKGFASLDEAIGTGVQSSRFKV
ncbi:MAG TPA: quinone-dependent dihydroorotate dehydrogenase [Pyrinomonadaceae bacterium]|nr:quinone-dependent dihydroorotate dehydrogenase [Pyrinomonadaceae bacterium]